MAKLAPIIFSSLFLCCLNLLVAANGPWPRPESLAAFWPLESVNGLNDISPNGRHLIDQFNVATIVTTMPGPFGQPSTSYSVKKDVRPLAAYASLELPPSVTISFFLYTKFDSLGGILQFVGLENRLALFYNIDDGQPCLELWKREKKDDGEDGRYVLAARVAALVPNEWNFVAITYSKLGGLTIYNKVAGDDAAMNQTKLERRKTLPSDADTELWVGYADARKFSGYMRKTDALACLMLYNTALNAQDVGELPYHCETKGQGTPRPPPPTRPPKPTKPTLLF